MTTTASTGTACRERCQSGQLVNVGSRTWSCTSNAEAEPGQGVEYLLLSWFGQRDD